MTGSMIENRVRTTMRASRIVWWMGMLAALGTITVAAQIGWTSALDLETLPQVVSLDEVGDVTITVGDLPLWLRALCWAPGIVTTGALAASAFLLSPPLVAVAGGRSFGDVAQRNLHRISLILILSAMTATALEFLAIWRLDVAISDFREAVQSEGVAYAVIYGTKVTIPWLPLALGVVAGAFRWVIRDGATLEQEADGVI